MYKQPISSPSKDSDHYMAHICEAVYQVLADIILMICCCHSTRVLQSNK